MKQTAEEKLRDDLFSVAAEWESACIEGYEAREQGDEIIRKYRRAKGEDLMVKTNEKGGVSTLMGPCYSVDDTEERGTDSGFKTKEQIIESMSEEMPFKLHAGLVPYIFEAMSIYASQGEKEQPESIAEVIEYIDVITKTLAKFGTEKVNPHQIEACLYSLGDIRSKVKTLNPVEGNEEEEFESICFPDVDLIVVSDESGNCYTDWDSNGVKIDITSDGKQMNVTTKLNGLQMRIG